MTLDGTDANIVGVLRTNPRITNKDIAARLDIAESTVAQRIRGMAERNVMRVVAQKHVFSDGYAHVVFLFVNTAGRTVQRVGADVSRIDGVFGVSQGIGNPDLFIAARATSMDDAQRISEQIAHIGSVATVETIPCFRIHKMVSTFGDLAHPSRPPKLNSESRNDRIFHAFYEDGRQSNREVSRQLDISEGAIRQRLKALQQSGEMQFQVVCNPLALGLRTTAIMRIATAAKETGGVLKRVVALEPARFVAEVAGTANVFALLSTSDNQSLGDLTDNELMSMSGVREVDAQILVANIKHGYYLSHFEAKERIPPRK
ncbi:MAG: Lrp/AsnC family transcriptional regulator [Gammaproteobacteria bacterium]|nr:Lrp/AsnC family transcriptional regulator [Gammaproteobacteria bacterium]